MIKLTQERHVTPIKRIMIWIAYTGTNCIGSGKISPVAVVDLSNNTFANVVKCLVMYCLRVFRFELALLLRRMHQENE